jgi:Flp pilus assembly protein TadG
MMMFSMISFSSIARAIATPVRRRGQSLARDNCGVAALEFGILLPFMVILLVGIADLGRALWQHHVLTKGVRDAARYLSRVADPTDGTAQGNAKNLIARGSFSASDPYLFSYWSNNSYFDYTVTTAGAGTYNNAGGAFRGPANIYRPIIKVVVTPPAGEFPLLSLFGGSITTYASQVQIRHIGE